MTSYFASLKSSAAISNLGTRLNSLRRAITSGDEADDPDSEDSSHVTNVLRAYYTEKGRTFPPWLPPDPKAPPPPQPRMVATQSSLQQGGYGQSLAPAGSRVGVAGGNGGLGDLWGDAGGTTTLPAPPQPQTASLRNRGSPSPRPVPSGLLPSSSSSLTPPPQTTARPLPSQRAGSYQNTAAAQQARLGLERSTSAQDRLRARVQGGGSGYTSSSPGSNPSPLSHSPLSGGGQQQVPAAATANKPWESDDSLGFDNGGYTANAYGGGGGGGYSRRPVGLPSGPQVQGRR
jgi:Mso1-like protein